LAVLKLQDRRPDNWSGPPKIEDHGLDRLRTGPKTGPKTGPGPDHRNPRNSSIGSRTILNGRMTRIKHQHSNLLDSTRLISAKFVMSSRFLRRDEKARAKRGCYSSLLAAGYLRPTTKLEAVFDEDFPLSIIICFKPKNNGSFKQPIFHILGLF
jgi:hypothetical protein